MMKRYCMLIGLIGILFTATTVAAKVSGKEVEYRTGDPFFIR